MANAIGRSGEPGGCGPGDLTLHHSSMLLAGAGSNAPLTAMIIEARRRIANRLQDKSTENDTMFW